MTPVNGSISLAWRRWRSTLGGAVGASSCRYFLAVRQSQPASRPTSAQVAPASRSARNRRTFIHPSTESNMGLVILLGCGLVPSAGRMAVSPGSTGGCRLLGPTHQAVLRTTHEVVH